VGGTRSTNGKELLTFFWLENLKGRNHSEDVDIDGRVILE
jgi:hypothetical protein